MGSINLKHTGSGSAIALSSDGTSLLLNGTAIGGGGGGADLYAANESSPTAQPSATGTNAIAIGDSAVSTGTDSFALGKTRATGPRSFAVNTGTNTSYGAIGADSIAMGEFAKASNSMCVAIGRSASSTSYQGLSLGFVATTTGNQATAIQRGLASGEHAFAAHITNSTTSYGASGANSIAMGWQTKATGANAIAIGRSSTSSDSNSIALGHGANADASASISILGSSLQNAYSFGYGAESLGYAGHDRSMMLGRGARSRVKGGVHFGGYNGLGAGRNQSGIYIVSLQSTDATPTALTTTNTTASTDNQVILPEDAAYAFQGTIVVRQNQSGTNAGTDSAAWKVEGLIRRESTASTTVLVSSTVTAISNTPSWGLALSADTTNGGLKIEATGQASRNLRWVGTIYTTEVLHQYA